MEEFQYEIYSTFLLIGFNRLSSNGYDYIKAIKFCNNCTLVT